MRLALLALIGWVLYSWLTGTSQSDINDRFTTATGKANGPHFFVKVFQPIHINGVFWRDYRKKVSYGRERTAIDSLVRHYAPMADDYYDTVFVNSFAEWESYKLAQEADSVLDSTTLLGRPVLITKHWESFDMFETLCLTINDSDELFDIDYDMFPGVSKELVDGDIVFTPESYRKYFNGLKELAQKEEVLSLRYLKKDSAELPYSVYEVADKDNKTLFVDEGRYEGLKTRYVRSDDGLGDIEQDERFTLWHQDWTFRIVAGILAVVTFFGFIADLMRSGRKAVYRINLLENDGNFSWEIIDKGKKVGPFSIPLEHFKAHVYLKTEEVQQPGKPPEQKKRAAGVVFINTPANEEEALYYHYYYQDYILTPQLIKQIAEKQKEAVMTFEAADILESKSSNEFESFWTHTYVLKGEEGESHTYHTTNRR